MTSWTQHGAMLRIRGLAHSAVDPVWTLGFRFKEQGQDPLTSLVNQLKGNNQDACQLLTLLLSAGLDSIDYTNLVGADLFDFSRLPDPDFPYVGVGAISSGKEGLDPMDPVHRIGSTACLTNPGWHWRPNIIKKVVHAPLKSLGSASARDGAVRGAYSAQRCPEAAGVFVVFDDIVTRGSTFNDIRRALLAANPGWYVIFVALAKAESLYYSPEADNQHLGPGGLIGKFAMWGAKYWSPWPDSDHASQGFPVTGPEGYDRSPLSLCGYRFGEKGQGDTVRRAILGAFIRSGMPLDWRSEFGGEYGHEAGSVERIVATASWMLRRLRRTAPGSQAFLHLASDYIWLYERCWHRRYCWDLPVPKAV